MSSEVAIEEASGAGPVLGAVGGDLVVHTRPSSQVLVAAGQSAALYVGSSGVGVNTRATASDSLAVDGTAMITGDAKLMRDALVARDAVVSRDLVVEGATRARGPAAFESDAVFEHSSSPPQALAVSGSDTWGLRLGNARVVGPGDVHGQVVVASRLYEKSETTPPFVVRVSFVDVTFTKTLTLSRVDDSAWVPSENSSFMLEPVVPDGTYAVVSVGGVSGNTCSGVKIKTAQGLLVSPGANYLHTPLVAPSAILDALNTDVVDPTLPKVALVAGYTTSGAYAQFSGSQAFQGQGLDRYLYDVESEQAFLVASSNSLEAVTGACAPLNMRSEQIASSAVRVFRDDGADAVLTLDLLVDDVLTAHLVQEGAAPNEPRFVEFDARAVSLVVGGRTFQLLPTVSYSRPSGSLVWKRLTVSLAHASEASAPQLGGAAEGYVLITTVAGAPLRGLAPFTSYFACDIDFEVMEEFVDVSLLFVGVAPSDVEIAFASVAVTSITVGPNTFPIVYKQAIVPGVQYLVRMLIEDFRLDDLSIGSVRLGVTYLGSDPVFPIKYMFTYRDCSYMTAPTNVPLKDFSAVVAYAGNRATADLAKYFPLEAFNPAPYNPYVLWINVRASTLNLASTYVGPSATDAGAVELVYDPGERNVLVTGLNSGTARLAGVPAIFTEVVVQDAYITTTILTVVDGTDPVPEDTTHMYVYLNREQGYKLLRVISRARTASGVVHELKAVRDVVDWDFVTSDAVVYTVPFTVSNMTVGSSAGGGGTAVLKQTARHAARSKAIPAGVSIVVAAGAAVDDADLGAPVTADGDRLTSRAPPADPWYLPADCPPQLPYAILASVLASGPSGSTLSSPQLSAQSSNDSTVDVGAGVKVVDEPVGGMYVGDIRLAAVPGKRVAALHVDIASGEFSVPPWAELATIDGVQCDIGPGGVATAPDGTDDGHAIVVVQTAGAGAGDVGFAATDTDGSFPAASLSGHHFMRVSDTDVRQVRSFAGEASGSEIALVGYAPMLNGVGAVLFEGRALAGATVTPLGVVAHDGELSGWGQVTVVSRPTHVVEVTRPGRTAYLTAPVSATSIAVVGAATLATAVSGVSGVYLQTPHIDTPVTVPGEGAIDIAGCVNDEGFATLKCELVGACASWAEVLVDVTGGVASIPFPPPASTTCAAVVSNALVAARLSEGQTTFSLPGAVDGRYSGVVLMPSDFFITQSHSRADRELTAWTSQTTAGRLSSPGAVMFVDVREPSSHEPSLRTDALRVLRAEVMEYRSGLASVRVGYSSSTGASPMAGAHLAVVVCVDPESAATELSRVGGLNYSPTLLIGSAVTDEGVLTVGGDAVVNGTLAARNRGGDAISVSVAPHGTASLAVNSREAMAVGRDGGPCFRSGVNAAAVRALSDHRAGDVVILDGTFADSALQHLRRARFGRDIAARRVLVMPEQPAPDGHTGKFAAGAGCAGDWMTGSGRGSVSGTQLTFSWTEVGALPGAGDAVVVDGELLRVASSAQTSGSLVCELDKDFGPARRDVVIDAVHVRDAVTFDALQLSATTAAAVHELGRAIRVVDIDRTRVHDIEVHRGGLRPLGSSELGIYVSPASAVAASRTEALDEPTSEDKRFGVTEAGVTSYVPFSVGQWTLTPSPSFLTVSAAGSPAIRIANDGSGALVNFTGVHRCHMPGGAAEDTVGLLVVADQEDYVSMSGGFRRGLEAVTVSESLPIVSLSSRARDPRVFGVVAGVEVERFDALGAVSSYTAKPPGDTRVYVNSAGEGALWVVDSEGPVTAGSYVACSCVPGYACAQGDDVMRSCTAAKLTMSCDFVCFRKPRLVPTGEVDGAGHAVWAAQGSEPSFLCRSVDSAGNVLTSQQAFDARAAGLKVYRAAFLGCVYTC